jgi:hypothetical protein
MTDYITKDEDILGDIDDVKKTMIDIAASALKLEHSNMITEQHIQRAVEQARQARRDIVVVEQERRRLEVLERLEIAKTSNSSAASAAADSDENLVNRKRQLEVNALDSAKKMITEVNAAVKRELDGFSAENTPYLRELKARLSAGQEEGDDEVMVQNTGPSEKDFICPYTALRMTVPMCTKHSLHKCTHRLDQLGLQALLKNKSDAACPVSGCKGVWSKGHFQVDEALQRKMERFDAVRKHTQSQQTKNSVTLDEYTAV